MPQRAPGVSSLEVEVSSGGASLGRVANRSTPSRAFGFPKCQYVVDFGAHEIDHLLRAREYREYEEEPMSVTFPNETPEYRGARAALLKREVALRREMEAVASQLRALPPGGEVPEDYSFDCIGADGSPSTVRMSALFRGGTRWCFTTTCSPAMLRTSGPVPPPAPCHRCRWPRGPALRVPR